MDVVHKRCCGLDVHKSTVVACLMTGRKKETRTFRTTTEQLRCLAIWLNEANCTAVAMESTGVYWKPIYNVLELSGMELLVVNARHIKAVPGRKTDVKDAEWICDLLRHGLLRGSFIPDRSQRELQELVHYRRSLVDERNREVNRIHKVLQGANIKLSDAVTDVLGVSGRAMLDALASGETEPEAIIGQVRTHLKADPNTIRECVEGMMGEHQQLLLTTQLEQVDSLNREIVRIDANIETRMQPMESIITRLDTIPGVGRIIAQEIVAAIGTDMTRFPTSAHLASWAKLCPGTNESAGKRKSARTGKGNRYLRSALTEAAQSAARSKDTYLRSQYYRLKSKRGANKATVAVAHTILVIAYYIIKDGTEHKDLGANHFDERRSDIVTRQLVRRLRKLGHKVTLEPAA
jgi:transposase